MNVTLFTLALRVVTCALVALLSAGGCAAPTAEPHKDDDDQASSETHFGDTRAFLRTCDEDGLCGGADRCACDVCTVSCEGLSDCEARLLIAEYRDEGLPSNVVCRAPMCVEGGSDEASAAGAVCDVSCEEDADCAFLDDSHDGLAHSCESGFCRTEEEPLSTELAAPPTADAATATPLCPEGMAFVSGTGSSTDAAVVSDLCFDLTEVTVAAYLACVDAAFAGCTTPESGNALTAGRGEHPVQFISAEQALAYCAFVAKRLPTRAEWQWAASNGGQSLFPWGDEAPTASDLPPHVCAQANTATCNVGATPAGDSSAGLHDLSGNVAELVEDGASYCAAGGGFDVPEGTTEQLQADACIAFTEASVSVGFRCAVVP